MGLAWGIDGGAVLWYNVGSSFTPHYDTQKGSQAMALQLGRSELGTFRAIERAASRWVATKTQVSRNWTSENIKSIYYGGWCALIGSVFLAAAVSLVAGAAMAGIAVVVLVASTAYDQRRSRSMAVTAKYPSELHAVCAYIESRIAEVEAERLGDKGEVTLLLQRVEAMRAEAASLHRTIGQRTQQGASGALLGEQDLQDAERVLASFDHDLAELRRFADALRAAFTAARGEIQDLVDPQSDFNVKRRLIELKASTGQVHQEVRALIAGSVNRIHGALGRIQSELKDLLVETGVQAALAVPLEGDLNASIAAREQIIRTFVRRAHALDIPFRPSKAAPVTETPGGAA